jgi:hypothetical protein
MARLTRMSALSFPVVPNLHGDEVIKWEVSPERFRKELDKLRPGRGKKKRRNDSELMTFLASL